MQVRRGDFYLWHRQNYTHGPRNAQHEFVLPFGLTDGQRVQDGRLSVEADDNSDKGAGVHRDKFHEHEEPTGHIPGQPLYSDVPHCVDRHHDKCHQQVRHGEIYDEDSYMRSALVVGTSLPQHSEITDCRHSAQSEGNNHSDFGCS